jgi:hypothetical protein
MAVVDRAQIKVGHLSAQCPRCGDRTSMPPCGEATCLGQMPGRAGHGLFWWFAVMHACTNNGCLGAVIAYYTNSPAGRVHELQFFVPRFDKVTVSDHVPVRPRALLQQANDVRSSPIPCVTTATRAVEAMLA